MFIRPDEKTKKEIFRLQEIYIPWLLTDEHYNDYLDPNAPDYVKEAAKKCDELFINSPGYIVFDK